MKRRMQDDDIVATFLLMRDSDRIENGAVYENHEFLPVVDGDTLIHDGSYNLPDAGSGMSLQIKAVMVESAKILTITPTDNGKWTVSLEVVTFYNKRTKRKDVILTRKNIAERIKSERGGCEYTTLLYFRN